jgi:MauM/NapG family ferredoxin protein
MAIKTAECVECFNCDDLCPAAPEIAVHRSVGKGGITLPDLEKRRLFASVAAGIIAVPLLRVGAKSRPEHVEPTLIRPPGALEENEFLSKCIRCGECMKVCITNGLQPALLEGGVEGLWTPVLVPRTGYCEYSCTLCGQVCPTGAIARLKPEEKMPVKIGSASVDRSRCLPYAYGIPCIVCEEVCPIPKKAIWFEKARVKDRSGNMIFIKQPHVDLELCNGCGICETKCPVLGRPAITVSSLGESRSRKNQLLLIP